MPTTHVPFVAHFRIVPRRTAAGRNGKRFDLVRAAQRLAVIAYDALAAKSTLTLARPGGGQVHLRRSPAISNGDCRDGMTFTPQMGAAPARISVAGSLTQTRDVVQPYPERTVIHAGGYVKGPGGSPWATAANPEADPTSTIATEVKSLKSLMETAIAAALPAGSGTVELFRLDYSGVKWGEGGRHFPV